jgi:hypothetical protein
MGQQQTMTVAAAEAKGGVTLLRRMILFLTVAVVMAAIMVGMAAPAFAASQGKADPDNPKALKGCKGQLSAPNGNIPFCDF